MRALKEVLVGSLVGKLESLLPSPDTHIFFMTIALEDLLLCQGLPAILQDLPETWYQGPFSQLGGGLEDTGSYQCL